MQGPIGRRRHSRPGVSGLIAGLFVFVMLFTVGTGFFIFVNSVNTSYVKDLSQRGTALQDSLSENIFLTSQVGANNHLTLTATNVGAITANLTDIMVIDPTGALHTYGLGGTSNTAPTLPAPVNAEATTPSFDTGLTIVPGTYTIKVISQRGDVYATTYPKPEASSISTLLSSFVVTAGGSVFDTATLAGVTPTAGGSVTYSYFSGGLCAGTPTVVSTVTVTNGIVPNSAAQTFNTVGSYSWEAVYTGDPSNSGANSVCEPLAVTASPVCVPSSTNICFASVSQGLGSVAIDWNSFRYYSYSSCGSGTGGSIDAGTLSAPTSSCALSPTKVTGAPLAYSISSAAWSTSGSVYHVFSINVTDADPEGRTMTVDGWTQLWFADFNLGSGGGRSHSEAYGMVLVNTLNGEPKVPLTTLTTTPQVTIAYGQTVTLFFSINNGGDPNNYGGGNATPIFMLFHGTLGTQQWAENFPLTTTFWLP